MSARAAPWTRHRLPRAARVTADGVDERIEPAVATDDGLYEPAPDPFVRDVDAMPFEAGRVGAGLPLQFVEFCVRSIRRGYDSLRSGT